MNKIATLIFILMSSISLAGEVITCGDARSVGDEAKLALHSKAQERAQKTAEEFMGKKITSPFLNVFGKVSDLESMSNVINVYWCETSSTPLHTAYYRFYTSNKAVYE